MRAPTRNDPADGRSNASGMRGASSLSSRLVARVYWCLPAISASSWNESIAVRREASAASRDAETARFADQIMRTARAEKPSDPVHIYKSAQKALEAAPLGCSASWAASGRTVNTRRECRRATATRAPRRRQPSGSPRCHRSDPPSARLDRAPIRAGFRNAAAGQLSHRKVRYRSDVPDHLFRMPRARPPAAAPGAARAGSLDERKDAAPCAHFLRDTPWLRRRRIQG